MSTAEATVAEGRARSDNPTTAGASRGRGARVDHALVLLVLVVTQLVWLGLLGYGLIAVLT
jgi:hypothetical protein